MRRAKLKLACLLALSIYSFGQAQNYGVSLQSELGYWQAADNIEMVGNLAYVTGGASGLHIMDLSDPAAPIEVGQFPWRFLGDVKGHVCVDGERAYLSVGGEGFVLDISDHTNPRQLGRWSLGAMDEHDFFARGDVGIEETPFGLSLVDVSDPSFVHVTAPFPGLPFGHKPIGIVNDYAFFTGYDGLSVWDISDRSNPIRVAVAGTEYLGYRGELVGNYAYLATYGHGLRIFDVLDPLDPIEVANCDSGYCYDVSVIGQYAVVSKEYQGIGVWNVIDPENPIYVGVLSMPGLGFGAIAGAGNTMCAELFGSADGASTASVIDISNPTASSIIASFGTFGDLGQFTVMDGVAYVSDAVGMRTISLANPRSIFELGNALPHARSGMGITVGAGHAYVSSGWWGLFAFDVTNPSTPDSVFSWAPEGVSIGGVCVQDNLLYVMDDIWIRVFNIDYPSAPELVNSVATPYLGIPVIVDGLLYAVGGHRLYIYSLMDPLTPTPLGSCQIPSGIGWRTSDIDVSGNYAYVPCLAGGVRIFDVSNPANPFEAGELTGWARTAVVSENKLIVLRSTGIDVLSLENPLFPTLIGHYDVIEGIRDMEIAGPYLYTSSETRFTAYEIDALVSESDPEPVTPQFLTLYPCYPNPFNAVTEIQFDLPHAAQVQVDVHNINGQIVATLMNGVYRAGSHHIQWDAREFSSGVYFCQIRSNETLETQKIVLIK